MTIKSQTWKQVKVDFATDLTHAQRAKDGGGKIFKIVGKEDFAQTLEQAGLTVVHESWKFAVATRNKVLRLPNQVPGEYLYYVTGYTLAEKLGAKRETSHARGLGSEMQQMSTRLAL